jgi:hypothetical protein
MEARSRTRFSHQLWPTLECVLLLPPRYLRPSFLASLVLFLLFLPLQPLTRNQTGYRQCRQRLRLAVRDGAAERVGGPLHLLASVRPPPSLSSIVFSPSLRARPPVDSSLPTYAAEERFSVVPLPSTVSLARFPLRKRTYLYPLPRSLHDPSVANRARLVGNPHRRRGELGMGHRLPVPQEVGDVDPSHRLPHLGGEDGAEREPARSRRSCSLQLPGYLLQLDVRMD